MKISFSVLMSLYINERADFFDTCMKSLLSQTVLPSEIVIVKDGPINSDVETILDNYIDNFPGLIKIIGYEKYKGLGYALNRGVSACSHELIARMDTDDIARTDRFEKQLAA